MRRLSVKESNIQGFGVFTEELIKKSEVVMIWSENAHICTEDEYNRAQHAGNGDMIVSGVRFVDNKFLWTKGYRIENYINHSTAPNLLYHCGVCFAMRDIAAGEELTVDYSYLLSENDDQSFTCLTTGRLIKGLSAGQCLRETTAMLMDILDQKRQ
jgi:SET domain-containing protein